MVFTCVISMATTHARPGCPSCLFNPCPPWAPWSFVIKHGVPQSLAHFACGGNNHKVAQLQNNKARYPAQRLVVMAISAEAADQPCNILALAVEVHPQPGGVSERAEGPAACGPRCGRKMGIIGKHTCKTNKTHSLFGTCCCCMLDTTSP